jgi:hypothetical protein
LKIFFKKNFVIGYIFEKSAYISCRKHRTAYLPREKTIDPMRPEHCYQTHPEKQFLPPKTVGLSRFYPSIYSFLLVTTINLHLFIPQDNCIKTSKDLNGWS